VGVVFSFRDSRFLKSKGLLSSRLEALKTLNPKVSYWSKGLRGKMIQVMKK
jgi:hypothetical protein